MPTTNMHARNYGRNSMGAHGWHGQNDSVYRAHGSGRIVGGHRGNSARFARDIQRSAEQRSGGATLTPGPLRPEFQSRVLDRYLDKAAEQKDFGIDDSKGGRGITKKELLHAFDKLQVTEDNVVSGNLAQVMLRHSDDFAAKKTAETAVKAASGDKDAAAELFS